MSLPPAHPDAYHAAFERFARNVRDYCRQHPFNLSFDRLVNALRKDIHSSYPFLFIDAVDQNDSPYLFGLAETLGIAMDYYYMHLILCDRIVDERRENELIEYMLLSNVLHRRAIITLSTFFPPNSMLWTYFERYDHECTNALLREQHNHWAVFQPYKEEEFIEIAAGKAAPAKVVATALALYAGKPELIERISHSQDFFHIAYQLSDDLKDWRKDYEAKQYSFILSKVIESHDLQNEVNSPTRPDVDTIGKMLYYSGVAEMGLDMCIEYLREAFQAVEQIYCPSWKLTIEQMKAKCIADKETITAKRRESLTKIGIACT